MGPRTGAAVARRRRDPLAGKGAQPHPGTSTIHADLACAHALNGEIERAAAELTEACGLGSDNRYSRLVRLRARRVHLVPTIRALFEATYDVGLHKAGMPEE